MQRIRLLLAALVVLLAAVSAASAIAGGSTFTFYRYQADFTSHTQSFQTWYGSKTAPSNAHIAVDCQSTDPLTGKPVTVREADQAVNTWYPVGGGQEAVTVIDASTYTGLSCVAYLLRGGGSNPLGSASFTAP